MNISEEKIEKIEVLILSHGSHTKADKESEQKMCAMEAVAWLAGEEHSDHPSCTCPVIAALVRRFNDRLWNDDERNTLIRPLLPILIGTNASREVAIKRGYLAADWSIRTMLPILCHVLGLEDQAKSCEALPAVIDQASGIRARSVAQDIRKSAYAADSADFAAAYAASAAYAATSAADSADSAADSAAYAAYADIRSRMLACRYQINASLVDLVRRMCDENE